MLCSREVGEVVRPGLLSGQVRLADLRRDSANVVIAHRNLSGVRQQIVSPPAIPAVIGLHPQNQHGKRFRDRTFHRAAGRDGHDFVGHYFIHSNYT